MNYSAILAFCVLILSLAACAKPDVRHFDTADVNHSSTSEVIDRIVEQESANLIFPSGIWVPIRLPATAPLAVVTSNALINHAEGLAMTPVRKFTIAETREVLIHERNYTAVRVNTDHGEMIVLLKFEPPRDGWWSRTYEDK